MKNKIVSQVIAYSFLIILLLLSYSSFCQNSLGKIIPNTNQALPSAYNFQEYVFPEPDDQGNCQGIQNASAAINEVFLAQTHRHEIGHPLLFTIGERPALLQIAVTGTGTAPDVQVEGLLNGNSLGTLCLKGPANLSTSIDLKQPNFSDYFSVTLPKAWIKEGLVLSLSAGNDSRTLSQNDLQITPYTELNLVLVNMDIMDYNDEPHRTPIFDDFLEELASAIPASVIRFGIFPEPLRLPSMALNNQAGNPVIISRDALVEENNLNTGMINLAGNYVLANMQQSLGDSPNTIYFGNTLNLAPGGWGGGGTFVSFDYTDVFIHELGHALSLPHWGEEAFEVTNPEPYDYLYPYGGELGEEAGGRGEAWNFNQDIYEFVSPICQDNNSEVGIERSDCMQREFSCLETRSDGPGPWDGFGDFSAKAINNYLLGSENAFGQVEDRGALRDFHLRENDGHPVATVINGERVFTRHPSQPQNTYAEEYIKLPGTEQLEQDVYLIYGSAHGTVSAANIIYKPIKYKGTLLPTIDPTNPTMFSVLQDLAFEDAPEFYARPRDLTLKLTYMDGTVAHTLVPFQSFERFESDIPDQELAPEYFSIVVPGDKLLCGVELYHREFIVLPDDIDEPGNINYTGQNITAANFMNDATLVATLDHSCNCPGTPGYVEPGTSCNDGNPLTINDVADGFCNCEGELVDITPCGFINNGQFEVNLEEWWTWGSDASSTNGEATFENIDFFDAGIAQGPFDFNMGENYTINFEAYAAQPRSIEVAVYLDEAPWTEYHKEIVNLSTTKQNYELSFTFNEGSVTNGAMLFDLKGNEANVFLDNVCLEEITSEEETTSEEEESMNTDPSCESSAATSLTTSSTTATYSYIYTPQPNGATNNQFRYKSTNSNNWMETNISNSYYRFLTDLFPSTTYEFQVRNECETDRWSEYSESQYFTTLGNSIGNKVSTFPSPLSLIDVKQSLSLRYSRVRLMTKEHGQRKGKYSKQMHCCAAHSPNAHCGGYTPKKSQTTSNYSVYSLDNTASPSPNKVLDFSASKVSLSQMQVIPNPLSQEGKIRLQVKESTKATIHLLDLNGRLVKELYQGPIIKGWNEFSIQSSNLPAGLYLVAFTAPTERLFQKVVIE